MIQFNLLPDVKVEFIKTRRRKRLIIFISVVTSSAAFAVFVLLFLFVRVNQAKNIRDLTKDIDSNVKTIQSTQDLDKILTIQNQLNSLPALHDKKIVSSRLVDYLNQLTPSQATISDVNVDFEANTLKVEGNADTLGTVNKFVDTIKFTDYKVNNGDNTAGKAFKDVVLNAFAVTQDDQTKKTTITYEITFTFEPAIFALYKDDNTNTNNAVTLTVPKIISTRSETEKPADLFAPQPQKPEADKPGGQR